MCAGSIITVVSCVCSCNTLTLSPCGYYYPHRGLWYSNTLVPKGPLTEGPDMACWFYEMLMSHVAVT